MTFSIGNQGISQALDMLRHRAEHLYMHSIETAVAAIQIAKTLGLDEHVQVCRDIALLHDVGKIAVADAILEKPFPLTEAEWVEMRKHPLRGAQILVSTNGDSYVQDLFPFVLQHHERPDGSGYPRGLTTPLIHPLSRIVIIADQWAAMTANRSYRG